MNESRHAVIASLIALLVCVIFPATDAYAQDPLTSVGTPSAVATFESVGIILPFAGDDNKDSSCAVEYREVGASAWKKGHDLWVDHRSQRRPSREFRGNIVHLKPGTDYEVRLAYTDPDGGSGSANLQVTTWSEAFPEGEVIEVQDRSETLYITESGTPDAYRVYTSPAARRSTLDAQNAHNYNIVIDASYVIVRGLNLTGPIRFGVFIRDGAHDLVLEDLDISNWGHAGIGRVDGWDYSRSSGIYADGTTERVVIQNNQIRDPRGGANSWASGPEPWLTGDHPMGPQAISFNQSGCTDCKGNHVIRYNHLYSQGDDHRFNDIIGGASNGGEGNLYRDSDIYGNILQNSWDDGLEIEGHNINIRVWGNVVKNTMKALATANLGYQESNGAMDSSIGPIYFWRNLVMDASAPYQSATKIRGNGGFYFYNNTVINAGRTLEAPGRVENADVHDVKMIGYVKNNILLPGSFATTAGDAWTRWILDYNLYSNDPTSAIDELGAVGWETHGIFNATPVFDLEGEFTYYLAAGDPGVDVGEVIPNFSDRYAGAGPDMGAYERGIFPAPAFECTEGETEACEVGDCAGERTCTSGAWSECEVLSPSECDTSGPLDLTAPGAALASEIDGELGEYASSGALEFSQLNGSDNSVSVRARWDAQALYVGVEIVDANVEVNPESRDGAIWGNDSVEISLDTQHDGGAQLDDNDYHFIIDADGQIWDGRGTGQPGNQGDGSWDSSIQAAAARTADGYAIEVAIPWADLGVTPAAGMQMGLFVTNNDLDRGEMSSFSALGAPPWNPPADWGVLTLAAADGTGEPDAGLPDAGEPDAGEPDAGSTPGQVDAGSDAGGANSDAGSTPDKNTDQDAGCGCAATSAHPPVWWALFALFGAVGMFVRARHPRERG